MKAIIVLFFVIFTSQYAISQSMFDANSENRNNINNPSANIVQSDVPAPPSISGYLDNAEYKAYRFNAYSSGATEYEWHVAGPGGVIDYVKYYPYTDEILVFFKTGSTTPIQVVCKAKNSAGWSEYTVSFHTITL